MLSPYAIEKLMLHGIFDSDSFVGIKGKQAIEQIIKHIIIAFTTNSRILTYWRYL